MAIRHKAVLVILDGLGDQPVPELGGLTPLEAADTPNLDRLAGESMCGIVDPLRPGVAVETTVGAGILMGMAPAEAEDMARGVVEATGVGATLAPHDIALRCNFACLERAREGLEILDRRAGRIAQGREQLAEALNGIRLGAGVRAVFTPATQHRGVLVLSGPDLSAHITDTDPGHWEPGILVRTSKPRGVDEASELRSAEALNHYTEEAHRVLASHPVNDERKRHGRPPANGIIARGAGKVLVTQTLLNERGISAAVVAAEHTVQGLGHLFRYTVVSRPEFTGLPDTDLAGKVIATREALEAHDVVFLHIKGPDICAHDLDPKAKRDFVEAVDQALAPLIDDNAVLAVSADHSTDSMSGRHIDAPVPTLLRSSTGERDSCMSYGENACRTGGLGRLTGRQFVERLLAATGDADDQGS